MRQHEVFEALAKTFRKEYYINQVRKRVAPSLDISSSVDRAFLDSCLTCYTRRGKDDLILAPANPHLK